MGPQPLEIPFSAFGELLDLRQWALICVIPLGGDRKPVSGAEHRRRRGSGGEAPGVCRPTSDDSRGRPAPSPGIGSLNPVRLGARVAPAPAYRAAAPAAHQAEITSGQPAVDVRRIGAHKATKGRDLGAHLLNDLVGRREDRVAGGTGVLDRKISRLIIFLARPGRTPWSRLHSPTAIFSPNVHETGSTLAGDEQTRPAAKARFALGPFPYFWSLSRCMPEEPPCWLRYLAEIGGDGLKFPRPTATE